MKTSLTASVLILLFLFARQFPAHAAEYEGLTGTVRGTLTAKNPNGATIKIASFAAKEGANKYEDADKLAGKELAMPLSWNPYFKAKLTEQYALVNAGDTIEAFVQYVKGSKKVSLCSIKTITAAPATAVPQSPTPASPDAKPRMKADAAKPAEIEAKGFAGNLTGTVKSIAGNSTSFTLQISAAKPNAGNQWKDVEGINGKSINIGTEWKDGKRSDPAQVGFVRSLTLENAITVAVKTKGRFVVLDDANGLAVPDEKKAVMFLGDSITARWKTLKTDFSSIKVANRGVGGDGTAKVLARLDTDVTANEPTALVLLIGTNDLFGGRKTAVILDNIREIIGKVRAKGSVPVVVCRVMPQDAKRVAPERVKELNALIDSTFTSMPQTVVCDTFTSLAKPDGTFVQDYFEDQVHPNAKGYDLMKTVIEKSLRELGVIK